MSPGNLCDVQEIFIKHPGVAGVGGWGVGDGERDDKRLVQNDKPLVMRQQKVISTHKADDLSGYNVKRFYNYHKSSTYLHSHA